MWDLRPSGVSIISRGAMRNNSKTAAIRSCGSCAPFVPTSTQVIGYAKFLKAPRDASGSLESPDKKSATLELASGQRGLDVNDATRVDDLCGERLDGPRRKLVVGNRKHEGIGRGQRIP